MLKYPRITLAPEVLAGKPVVRGTRLSVEFVIGLLADGWSEADILENYQGITLCRQISVVNQGSKYCVSLIRDQRGFQMIYPLGRVEGVTFNNPLPSN